jgi:hypothetical protein
VAGVVRPDQHLDPVHRHLDLGPWNSVEHMLLPFHGGRRAPEQPPPTLGELERRTIQVAERAQPCLLVGLGSVTDDFGRESLEQLDRIVLGCRLQAVEESDERGGSARLRQTRQNGGLHALAEASQPEKDRWRKAFGDGRPDRLRTDDAQPFEAAGQLGG